ncbi:MAG: hypothetical protein ACRCXH_14185, partial [Shewanella sp.]
FDSTPSVTLLTAFAKLRFCEKAHRLRRLSSRDPDALCHGGAILYFGLHCYTAIDSKTGILSQNAKYPLHIRAHHRD